MGLILVNCHFPSSIHFLFINYLLIGKQNLIFLFESRHRKQQKRMNEKKNNVIEVREHKYTHTQT